LCSAAKDSGVHPSVTIVLATGERVQATVDVPSGTPVSQGTIPGITGTVREVIDHGPVTATTPTPRARSSSRRVANRVALNRAVLAMADSQTLFKAMVDLGGHRESMLLMSWGVDLKRFRPTERERSAVRAELGLPEGRIISARAR
jgi:hypothetical protein